jgi:hypothetical protein
MAIEAVGLPALLKFGRARTDQREAVRAVTTFDQAATADKVSPRGPPRVFGIGFGHERAGGKLLQLTKAHFKKALRDG